MSTVTKIARAASASAATLLFDSTPPEAVVGCVDTLETAVTVEAPADGAGGDDIVSIGSLVDDVE